MPEYIEREAFESALKDNHDAIMQYPTYSTQRKRWEALRYNRVRSILSEIPAADVAEVRHGKWKSLPFGMHYCSECRDLIGKRWRSPNYCPNCGAKMDGEAK